ncbi:MAG TPA: ferritin-like domain-containing protein [Burkholderiaceae bacterium]|nr:ferritin-like domain-containing protein [Burkholderiaceae bacterium]
MRTQALAALLLADPDQKLAMVRSLAVSSPVDAGARLDEPPGVPGRPIRPERVPPFKVRQRSVHTLEGRAALVHSLAHIEFNAINLALDAVWRFPGMPDAYYADWLRVARDEACHFGLLRRHLRTLGHDYGDFPAHDGLWDMAWRTRDDIMARLALVPRTLEARGLDASPIVRDKLEAVGDAAGANLIEIILHDEIGHVAVGNFWYRYLCDKAGLDPLSTYRSLAVIHRAPRLRGPFNTQARRAAGFTEQELEALRHDALGV